MLCETMKFVILIAFFGTFHHPLAAMSSLPEIQCPTCRKHFAADIHAPSMPFCSMRCKLVDLNHWFSEEVGLPVHACDDPEQEDEPQEPASPKEYRFD